MLIKLTYYNASGKHLERFKTTLQIAKSFENDSKFSFDALTKVLDYPWRVHESWKRLFFIASKLATCFMYFSVCQSAGVFCESYFQDVNLLPRIMNFWILAILADFSAFFDPVSNIGLVRSYPWPSRIFFYHKTITSSTVIMYWQ